ncbi:coiled-coil domain-containing protein 142 isoform X2 [Hemicordylus capensis]|nr:coiled-coil domain-containing protein 142 isoform X2 [Hemicordylus capensis]XP_053110538.1 coiled-coil domain-containing protein 142 isoform X2 [Hemicordylus capensis]XP_053110539.1 coiled-coil domain-containing protein 142 isoform X2 [Hemicordylus capensis]
MSRVSQASGAILPPLGSLMGLRKASPADGGEALEPADPGSGSFMPLARSLQRAEALLRHCVNPRLRRLLPPRPSEGSYDSEEEEEEAAAAAPGSLARLAQVERTFLALSRCLRVQENPRTETFQAHMRPEAAQGPFSYHTARTGVARHCATLHALLQHRHRLRLARHYSLRLRAASDFVRRLAAAERCRQDAGQRGRLLRGLCEELRTHALHWEGLQRRLHSDPWLRSVLLQRPEAVLRMKEALTLLALRASLLLERQIEALLRSLARGASLPPAPLADLFQGLEIYNQVVSHPGLQRAFAELPAEPAGGEGGSAHGFPVERVLGILAAERGRLAARRLHLLLPAQQAGAGEAAPWEGPAEAWLRGWAPQAPPAGEEPSSLSAELQALCQEEEALMLLVLGKLVASSDSLWHHVLHRPQPEKPLQCPEPSDVSAGPDAAALPSWKAVRWWDASFAEAAAVLYARYRPLLWRATAASLAHQLELQPALAQSREWVAATWGQRLSRAVAQARVPPESAEELRALALHLLMRDVRQHWDRGFCRALGSSLTDKCVAKAAPAQAAACSQTAQHLQPLCLPLAFSLSCWDAQPAEDTAGQPSGPTRLRLELLSLLLATSHASCYWVMSKAHQYLASWSLSQFLLVTQGDLQLLKAEMNKLSALVSSAFFGEGRREESPLASHWQQELSLQVLSSAASIQLFAKDVLKLFSSDCKRMSAEIFGQTMPLGKHWRLALQTELPSAPSEYASAAAQTVLGQVLQGLQLLPQEAQAPALSQVTTAFLEAWMDHILAQKIVFSLQGALQLKQDFDLVRELLQSEDSGLSLEIRQLVLSLRVFQQVDNALACLLQQPAKASLPSHTWDTFRKCCSSNGIHTQESGAGSLNSLESLEGLPVPAGAALPSQAGDLLSRMQAGGCSPETYLSPTQQEWLALRLQGGRRWKVPGLPCMSRATEP